MKLHGLFRRGKPGGIRLVCEPDEIVEPGLSLARVNLSEAKLHRVDLSWADLRRAKLCGADLTNADLRYAKLCGADLTNADLREADLIEADLSGAKLADADLRWANLTGADLEGAVMLGADMRDTHLWRAEHIPDYVTYTTLIVPDGDIVGWKKLRDDRIAKLLIPASARRSNATGRMCRAEYAQVIAIYQGDTEVQEGISLFDNKLVYRVGETVYPDAWDDDRWHEFSSGIHFYITRFEAEKS